VGGGGNRKVRHEVCVSNTRKVPYICQSDAKDDPVTPTSWAELLYFKPRLLHSIQHHSLKAQADLSWIRTLEVLVTSRAQLINAVFDGKLQGQVVWPGSGGDPLSGGAAVEDAQGRRRRSRRAMTYLLI
jgi:hypothetical protein